MRIGIAGKGGVGKTTLSATLSRLAARSGARVVAIDADSNPNLPAALGMPAGMTARAHPLPASVVSRRFDGPALTASLDSVLAEHGVPGPDGVVVLSMGGPAHAGEGCLCSAHAIVGAVLADLREFSGGMAVVDMEASPEQLSRGTVRNVDALLLVAEPYYRSLETVRRLAPLAAELSIARIGVVANKLGSPADADAVEEFCRRHGLACWGRVPYGDEVAQADLRARAVLDDAPGSDYVRAVESLLATVRRMVGAAA